MPSTSTPRAIIASLSSASFTPDASATRTASLSASAVAPARSRLSPRPHRGGRSPRRRRRAPRAPRRDAEHSATSLRTRVQRRVRRRARALRRFRARLRARVFLSRMRAFVGEHVQTSAAHPVGRVPPRWGDFCAGDVDDDADDDVFSIAPGVTNGVLAHLGSRTARNPAETLAGALVRSGEPTGKRRWPASLAEADAASEKAVDVFADIDCWLAAAVASARRSRRLRSCASFSASATLSCAFLALAASKSAAAAAATVSIVRCACATAACTSSAWSRSRFSTLDVASASSARRVRRPIL